MAAKAEPKSTGDEIWFNDAVTKRVGTWGSEEDAEQALVRDLKNGWPWSHRLPDGTRVPGDAKFWNEPFVNVDRKNNRAWISPLISSTSPFWRDGSSDVPGKVRGIKVARAAALALVPENVKTPAAEQYDDRPQLKRAIQSLRRIFPPDGKVPVGMPVATVRGKIDADLAEENRNLGKATPGWDIIKEAIAILGRRGD